MIETILIESLCEISVQSTYIYHEGILIDIIADIDIEAAYQLTPPVVLPAQNTEQNRQVNYIADIYLHTLHDTYDDQLEALLYKDDYIPTKFFKNLVNKLHNQFPVLWDYFRWDEGYWNLSEDSLSYMPVHWDEDIDKWRLYDVDAPLHIVQQRNKIKEIPNNSIIDFSSVSLYELSFSPLDTLMSSVGGDTN